MLRDFINDLKNEFKGYNADKFSKDLMAGITVAAVALPLALAFGVGSGATAASGMITAIVAGLIITIFSGSSYQISGPTGAMSAILMSLVLAYGLEGVFFATFLAGVMLLIAGIFKIGKIVSIIPTSVIAGFTSGIAITIMMGQIDNFFGTTSVGETTLSKFLSYFENGFNYDLPTIAIGVLTFAIIALWPKKAAKYIPGSLGSLIIILIITQFVNLDIALVGEIPQSLILDDRLTLSSFNLANLSALLSPALTIAALGMIESLLCGAAGGKMRGEKLNADRELVAQGIGNMIVPFFGGIPATAAIARTSVAIKSGGQTRVTGIIHALILVLTIFVLAPIMSIIPMASLAAVLFYTCLKMSDYATIKYIFTHKFKGAMTGFLLTLLTTVIIDLTAAIVVGVGYAFILFVMRSSDIEINISGLDKDKMPDKGESLANIKEKIRVVYLAGPIFFASMNKIEESLAKMGATDIVIFSMRGVPAMDASGVQLLKETLTQLREQNIEAYFCGVQNNVYSMMIRGEIIEFFEGENRFYWSADKVILALAEKNQTQAS